MLLQLLKKVDLRALNFGIMYASLYVITIK